MLTDAARLTALLTNLARTGEPVETRRAAAIRDYLTVFGAELHEHHSREDHIAWPVIAASAGAAIDLAPLTQDHAVLAPLIDTMVRTAGEFAAEPAAHAMPLALSLRELSGLLHEHIPEEERDVLPVISRYVSVADWEAVERQMRAGLSLRHLAWVLPWLERFATPRSAGVRAGQGRAGAPAAARPHPRWLPPPGAADLRRSTQVELLTVA